MASLTAGTTFTDGVANDVTAAKLGALVTNATPTSGFIQDRTAETVVATNDTLLIGDASDSNNLKRMTVANLLKAPLVSTSGTIDVLTTGTTTSTAEIVTSGTIATLNSTTGTIATLNSTTGTIATLNSTTGTIATLNSTTGTIATLNSTTGTIATFNSTTGTIPTLVATTLITTGTGTAAAPAIVPTGDTNTGIFFPAADTIAFAEGGAEAMRIDSSGKVLIGTTSNDTGGRLEVKQASSETGIGIQSSGTDDSKLYFRTASGTYGGDILFNGSYVKVSSGTTERLRIDSSGNVGIGISPSEKLHVSGNAIITGDISQTNGATNLARNSSGAALSVTQSGAGAAATFSGGNVGIGTTSPSATLHSVSASASTAAGIFQITATSSTSQAALSVIKQDSNTTTNQTFVLFQHAGGTNCGKINANGANTAAFGSTSDARLKENITALPSQIDNVCALRPCEFDYKDGSGHQIGFIAQEMQEVYPDSVGVGDDGMLTITAWSKTEARLVKAIQELKAKNDSLEARLETLEAK